MKGEWCYYYRGFTPDECNKILFHGLSIPEQNATVGTGAGYKESPGYRNSKVRFIQRSNDELSWVFDKMWRLAIDANDKWFQVHISRLDFIQLAEYDASYEGKYDKHHDVFWMTNTDYQRKLSAVVQLTNAASYEGGDLELLDAAEKPSAEQLREQGTVTFFPSMMHHKANKVTKGKRYSLACWFEGPHWR